MSWEEVPLFIMAYPEPEVKPPSAAVTEVFDFWVEKLRYGAPTRVVLSDVRRRKIEKALELYDIQTCKDAILGCSESDFHMGNNGYGKKYDDIELILRDAQHIERFAAEHREKNDF